MLGPAEKGFWLMLIEELGLSAWCPPSHQPRYTFSRVQGMWLRTLGVEERCLSVDTRCLTGERKKIVGVKVFDRLLSSDCWLDMKSCGCDSEKK